MSDKPISKGDLVVVVRGGGCAGDHGLGHVFRVLWVERTDDVICLGCGQRHGWQSLAIEKADEATRCAYGVDVRRLKRIDPDATPERTDTQRELEAV